MLHNATRLEQTWHQTKICAPIDQWSIREELLRCSPEAIRVPLFKIPHSMGALSGVGVVHVAGTADKELNFVLIVRNDVLSNVQNQMHTLLLCDSSDEGKERHTIIQVTVVEVLHLKQSFRANVIR